MENKKPVLSFNYVLIQLEILDFEKNNSQTINKIANELYLHPSKIHLIYNILRLIQILESTDKDINFVNIASRFNKSLAESKQINFQSQQSSVEQISNKFVFNDDVAILIEKYWLKYYTRKLERDGLEKTLKNRFSTQFDRKRTVVFNSALLLQRNEIENYLKDTSQHRFMERVNYLTNLLKNNPKTTD